MIRVTDEGPVRVVRLDRADKRNALTPAMLADLTAAFDPDPPPEIRAACLLGEGKAFCSGFDLTLARDGDASAVLTALLEGLSAAVQAMRAFPHPVVLGCHGAAVAGGAALLGGADAVVTDASCAIGYPVVRLGISPAVSAPFLRQSVHDGPTRARLLDPELIDGRRAHELGLVGTLVETAGDVPAHAMALARTLAAKPGNAAPSTKRWLLDIEAASSATPDDAAAGLAASLALTDDHDMRERLAALWNRRA